MYWNHDKTTGRIAMAVRLTLTWDVLKLADWPLITDVPLD